MGTRDGCGPVIPLFDPTRVIFVKEGHEYYVEVDETTRKLPSLSHVIKRQGMAPIYKDEVPPYVLEKAARRGDAVHAQLHNLLSGRPKSRSLPEDVGVLVTAGQTLIKKNKMVPVYTETPLFNPVFDYCCTPDFVGMVQGRPAIVDWKTTATIHWQAGFQLAGQALCFREPELFDLYIGDTRRAVLVKYDSTEFLRVARNAFQVYNDIQDLEEKYS